MITNELSGIVLRYKNSTNKDKKNDYIKMMGRIDSDVELTTEEREEVENDVINHFLNISPKGKELFNILYDKERQKCIDGDELAKLYVETVPENREKVYESFKELYKDSNPDTKAYLMNLERWKMKKSKIADKLRQQMLQEQKTSSSKLVELTYLQDAKEQLFNCTSVDEIVELYKRLAPSIHTMLSNEELLDKTSPRFEHKQGMTELKVAYITKLTQLEGEDMNPVCQCNNNDVLGLMYNRVKNMKPTEDVETVLEELFNALLYRFSTLRTYRTSSIGTHIMRKFLVGKLLLTFGKTDLKGMIDFWIDEQPISEKFLQDNFPLNVCEMVINA